ncbi:hypothetical protein B0H34DRAFT_783175 [Crassisporium funariophilum]|nr:hypothetical protein B0H34DRAFT_783175 [Crassisporium funariophilum]
MDMCFMFADLTPSTDPWFSLPSSLPHPPSPDLSPSSLSPQTISPPASSKTNKSFTCGATSFASQHPLKDVQPPRFQTRGSRSDAVKLGMAERRQQKEEKSKELNEGVAAIIKNQDTSNTDLAEQISVTEKHIQTLFIAQTHYVKHCKPNLFNALVHKATSEMNDDLAAGEHHKIDDIQAIVQAGMDTNAFSPQYQAKAMLELEEHQQVKTMGSQSSNTALLWAWAPKPITGLAIFAKSHIHNDFANAIVEFNGLARFFLDVFNMQPADVCSKFQQWVCNQKITFNVPNNLQAMQNECSTLVKNGLCMVTNCVNLGMNYINYWTSIVQKHHVELLGWPNNIPFTNPHQITIVSVARKLQQALLLGTCKWVVMTRQRQKDHAAALAVDVKAGTVDKGKKRKHTVAVAEEEESKYEEDTEREQEDDDEEDDEPPPAKKYKLAPTAQKRNTCTKTSKTASAATKCNAASAAKKAQHMAKVLPSAAPKSKETINTKDDDSD